MRKEGDGEHRLPERSEQGDESRADNRGNTTNVDKAKKATDKTHVTAQNEAREGAPVPRDTLTGDRAKEDRRQTSNNEMGSKDISEWDEVPMADTEGTDSLDRGCISFRYCLGRVPEWEKKEKGSRTVQPLEK